MTNIKLRANFYFIDGTSQLNYPLYSLDLPSDKGVLEMTVSPYYIKGAATQPENISYYEVWMEYASTRISEIRTYRIDFTPYENQRYFLFLNSLGGYDTFRTTGQVTDLLNYERTSVNKVLGSDFTEMNHQTAPSFISEIKTFKAHTGWLSREDITWVRDFLLSKQIYQIRYNKLIPIIITSTQAQQFVDQETLYSIEFEYREAFYSEYYTRQIQTASFSDAFNDDFANE